MALIKIEQDACAVQVAPLCESNWDRLPRELVKMVFKHSDILTLFLCGRLDSVDELDEETAKEIWHHAFRSGWLGNYSLLPPVTGPDAKFKLTNKDLVHVTSHELYMHLCKFFPEASESNPVFANIDTHINKALKLHDRVIVPSQIHRLDYEHSLRLIHIAINNVWTDDLHTFISQVPYALAHLCVLENHDALLSRLFEESHINASRFAEFQYTTEKNETHVNRMMDIAAFHGHLQVLQVMHEKGCNGCTPNAMDWAAKNGHKEVVEWLHENRSEGCTTNAMDLAASNGHVEIVKWLHDNRTEGCTSKAMDRASANGHLAIVKWLGTNREEGCTIDAMIKASKNGHLDVVKWLDLNFEMCSTDGMDLAAANGHLDVVQWLHRNRDEGCTTKAMDRAAEYNHFHVVKWLDENRSEGCTMRALHKASMNGHVEIVQYLLNNRDMKPDPSCLEKSVENGHIDVVRVLMANGGKVTVRAVNMCKSQEIADVLVGAMNRETRKNVLMELMKKDCRGPGVAALHLSLVREM